MKIEHGIFVGFLAILAVGIFSGLHTDGAVWSTTTVKAGQTMAPLRDGMPLVVACVDSVARLHADGSVDVRPLKVQPESGCIIYSPVPPDFSVSHNPKP